MPFSFAGQSAEMRDRTEALASRVRDILTQVRRLCFFFCRLLSPLGGFCIFAPVGPDTTPPYVSLQHGGGRPTWTEDELQALVAQHSSEDTAESLASGDLREALERLARDNILIISKSRHRTVVRMM
jgi:hypothetical protein